MYGKIMSSCLDDALSSDTVQNTKYMSWYKRLASKEAFVENLFAQIITVLGEFRFTKTVGNNLATFEITQDGVTMRFGAASQGDNRALKFHIDFNTGLVTAVDAKLSGSITANSGTFHGKIEGTNGYIQNMNAYDLNISGNSKFQGELQCGGLKVIPKESNNYYVTADEGSSQCSTLLGNLAAAITGSTDFTAIQYLLKEINGHIFEVSSSNIPGLRYIYPFIMITSGVFWLFLYDNNLNSLNIANTGLEYTVSGTSFGDGIVDVLISSGSYGVWINQTVYMTIKVANDEVYLSVPIDPSTEKMASLKPGQLYIDSNGTVKTKLPDTP